MRLVQEDLQFDFSGSLSSQNCVVHVATQVLSVAVVVCLAKCRTVTYPLHHLTVFVDLGIVRARLRHLLNQSVVNLYNRVQCAINLSMDVWKKKTVIAAYRVRQLSNSLWGTSWVKTCVPHRRFPNNYSWRGRRGSRFMLRFIELSSFAFFSFLGIPWRIVHKRLLGDRAGSLGGMRLLPFVFVELRATHQWERCGVFYYDF